MMRSIGDRVAEYVHCPLLHTKGTDTMPARTARTQMGECGSGRSHASIRTSETRDHQTRDQIAALVTCILSTLSHSELWV
jgi:hypothetical protein